MDKQPCKICGGPITTPGKYVLCGSPDCEREDARRTMQAVRDKRRRNLKPRQCSECGKPFSPRDKIQKTCGAKDCRSKRAHRLEKERKERLRKKQHQEQSLCPECMEPFENKTGRKTYCSPKCCQEAYRREKRKPRGRKSRNKCLWCGDPIPPLGRGKYCSEACVKAKEADRTRREYEAEVAGFEIDCPFQNGSLRLVPGFHPMNANITPIL